MVNIDLNNFSNIYEIELTTEPNQSFNVYLQDYNFKIDIRTFVGEQTRITIRLDDEIIVNNAPVNIPLINLNYFSNFDKGVFFFTQDKSFNNANFENFGNGLRLYYGNF